MSSRVLLFIYFFFFCLHHSHATSSPTSSALPSQYAEHQIKPLACLHRISLATLTVFVMPKHKVVGRMLPQDWPGFTCSTVFSRHQVNA